MDEEGDRISVASVSDLRCIVLKRENRVNPTTGSRNVNTKESSKHKATKNSKVSSQEEKSKLYHS